MSHSIELKEPYSSSMKTFGITNEPIESSKCVADDKETLLVKAAQNDEKEMTDINHHTSHSQSSLTNSSASLGTFSNNCIIILIVFLITGVILANFLALFCVVKINKSKEDIPNEEVSTANYKGEYLNETGSSSYIRWGMLECPNTAETVYSGYAGGTHWSHDGGGSNYLCLHGEPEYDRPVSTVGQDRAFVDGVEYEVENFPPFSSQNYHNVQCVVCRVATRGTMIMIPARMTCPSGWTREYYGYLMSNKWDYKRTEFICVDRDPEIVGESNEKESGSIIQLVEIRCYNSDPNTYTGGLPCDKFPLGNELSCVVCTK